MAKEKKTEGAEPKPSTSIAGLSPASPIHRSRYYRNKKEKKTVEEIAEEDKVPAFQVEKSLKLMEEYYQTCTDVELNAAQISIILELTQEKKKALKEALGAKKPVMDDGRIVGMEPDHNIRLQAVSVMNETIEAIQPKGKGFSTNVNVGVGVMTHPGVGSGGTFEDRLREIRQKRAELPPAPPQQLPVNQDNIIDSEYEEIIEGGNDQPVDGTSTETRPLP